MFASRVKVANLQKPKNILELVKRTLNTHRHWQTGAANGNWPESFKSHIRKMSADAAKFQLKEVDGDLFTAPPTYSLGHCVGADFAMGAGIAVKFKQIYGKVDELRAQGIKTGGVAVLKDKERYIYYMVTKPASYGSPTYDDLRSSLCAMRNHMVSNNVRQLAIPRIGCGIDGLEWDKVSAQLRDVFEKEDLEIVVYNFVPK